MGAKRKVNKALYAKIKAVCKTPKDDKKVMKQYKLGQTAVRAIRRSWSYDDYLARTSHSKKKITLNSSPRRTKGQVQEQAFKAWAAFMILAIIGMFVVCVLIIRWILSLFGI